MRPANLVKMRMCAAILMLALPMSATAQTPPAAPLEAGAKLPASVADLKIENATGTVSSLAEFRGKVVMLTIVGRWSSDAATRLSTGIALDLADQPDLARVSVGDLKAAPGFMRASIRQGIVAGYRKTEAQQETVFKAKGLSYAEHRAVLLLDWRGEMARQFGVAGKTDRTYQIYILDRQGGITAHFTQQKDQTEATTRSLVTTALKKALESKTETR